MELNCLYIPLSLHFVNIFFVFLKVEVEKLRDKNGVAERELRGTISECEKARSEAASLQLEVERFAARMGKYQDSEERMTEEMHRYRIESEKYKERLDKANGEIEFLKNTREKAEDEINRLRNELSSLESARYEFKICELLDIL